MKQIPPEVQKAAKLVGDWFKMQGIERWELMDVCSRNHATCDITMIMDHAFRMQMERDAMAIRLRGMQ